MHVALNSGLVACAADYVGRYAPFQGIEIAPLRPGQPGVTVASYHDNAAAAVVGYDPNGTADETLVLIPPKDLVAACRSIKSAERDVRFEGDPSGVIVARVTTYYKEHTTAKDFTCLAASSPFPPCRQNLLAIIERWGSQPAESATAGRYDLALLGKIVKGMADETGSIVLSAFTGGPLRLQREDTGLVIMIMPQAAVPIPPQPDWLLEYARSTSE